MECMGEGYSVRIQHCENPGCDKYLGVNYPSDYCGNACLQAHRRLVMIAKIASASKGK
jgi:hypothetical protein